MSFDRIQQQAASSLLDSMANLSDVKSTWVDSVKEDGRRVKNA